MNTPSAVDVVIVFVVVPRFYPVQERRNTGQKEGVPLLNYTSSHLSFSLEESDEQCTV